MKTLVAGIGKIFCSDDGFGVEVAKRLVDRPWPDDVHVEDFGIRGMHLALELLEGYDLLVLVDAMSCGETPGTVFLMDPDPVGEDAPPLDAHRMDPYAVLGMVNELGGEIGRVRIVGCEPSRIEEGMGLSPTVAAAVDGAIRMVEELIQEDARTDPPVSREGGAASPQPAPYLSGRLACRLGSSERSNT
ncbi:MAG: hydrogenase maturation protease [Acidimicrobiales bacterium]